MKRLIAAAAALILIFSLCACNNGNPAALNVTATQNPAEPAQTPASTPSQDTAGQEPDGRGDILDGAAPAGAEVLRKGVFYYQNVEINGDSGDGLSPREGAELTDSLLGDIGFYGDTGLTAGQCVYISLDELAVLDSVMGRECYIYTVGLGTVEGGLWGGDYQAVYRVSVDYSGNKTASIYEDFSGGDAYFESNDAGWNGDPGDGGLVAWWGTYTSSDYSIEITEVTGISFYYVIRMTTTTQNTIAAEGRADIDDTGYFATAEGMGFSLYDDLSAIDIFISEGSGLDELRGQYERIE